MPAYICYHAFMPRQLTIRGVDDEVAERLERLSRAQNKSVNAVVLGILEGAVDARERKRRLKRYTTWTAEDLAEFSDALQGQRQVDTDLWG